MSLNQGGLLVYLDSLKIGNHDVWYMVFTVAIIVFAYLLGSVNSSIVISKVIYRDDVRTHGSGNAGLTNMLRTFGKGAALLTLLGDLLKTTASIFISAFFFGFWYSGGVSTGDGMCYVAALFTVIGHIAPLYYKFKGGKGVLTTAVSALILCPIPFVILFLMFVIIVAISKYVSLGSVIAAVFFPVVLNAYFAFRFPNAPKSMPGLAALSTILIAIVIVYCHRENLKRISEKTERKLSFKKKDVEVQKNDQPEE